MAKPNYTVVVDTTGKFLIKHLSVLGSLRAKGTSYYKANKIKEQLDAK